MKMIRDVLLILASLALVIFVSDEMATKYNTDENNISCSYDPVQDLLIQVATDDVKESIEKQGFIFSANVIKENTILGNIEDVINDSRGSNTYKNEIVNNYWDNYEGFDKNGDNIGDTPHKVFQYADQLWVYNPNVKFFYGSPVISLLNFLAKLAPFSQPVFLMSDKEPKLKI